MIGRVVLQIILFSVTATGMSEQDTEAGKNNKAKSTTDVQSDADREREEKPLLKPQMEQQRETNVSNEKKHYIYTLLRWSPALRYLIQLLLYCLHFTLYLFYTHQNILFKFLYLTIGFYC